VNILHVHGGFLPDYKGSTTNYYSILKENYIGASSIFLTPEIDSGPIILRKKFNVPDKRFEIDHFYDSAARARVLVESLKFLLDNGVVKENFNKDSKGQVYYIIHPVLKAISIFGK
jgi:methionyl-tRNA formyltransferase